MNNSVRCIFNVKFSQPQSKDWEFYASTSTTTANNFNTYITRKMEKLIPNENMTFEQINRITEELNNKNFDMRVDWWEKKNEFNINKYMENPKKSKGLITKENNYNFEEIVPELIKQKNELLEAHPNSNIWHSVISFDENSSTNFDLEKNQALIAKKAFEAIMKHNELDQNIFTYKAAFHTNTSHHHLHLTFYQPNNIDNNKIIVRGKLKHDTFIKINLDMNKIVKDFSFLFEHMYETKKTMIKEYNHSLETKKTIVLDIKNIYSDLMKYNNGIGKLNYKNTPDLLKTKIDILTDKILDLNKTPMDLFKNIVKNTYDQYYDRLITKSNWTNKDIRTGVETNPEKTIKQFKTYINNQKQLQIDNLYKDLGNKLIKHIKTTGKELEILTKVNTKNKITNKYSHDLTINKLELKTINKEINKVNNDFNKSFKAIGVDFEKSNGIGLNSIFKAFKNFFVETNKDLDNYWDRVHKEIEQEKGVDYEM